MAIKFLKAGKGDSILIQNDSHNILIDGGDDSFYLQKELLEIYNKGEKIDLLFITHHDDDHIIGIIHILKQIENGLFGINKDFIRQVYFNSPRMILNRIIPQEEQFLSYKKSYEIEELLQKIQVKWDEVITNTSPEINLGNIKLTILSPLEKDLNKYSEKTPKTYLSSQSRGDWESPMNVLNRNLDDESQDNTIPNRSSIVVLLEIHDYKILLTGDVTPDRFEAIINELYLQNNNLPVFFDFIKLPHHGSHRNLSKQILSKIICKNFIITTNGKNSFLPDKRALLKIVNYVHKKVGERINFIFNYGEVIEFLNISKIEELNLKITQIRNNENCGYVIR